MTIYAICITVVVVVLIIADEFGTSRSELETQRQLQLLNYKFTLFLGQHTHCADAHEDEPIFTSTPNGAPVWPIDSVSFKPHGVKPRKDMDDATWLDMYAGAGIVPD